MSDLEARMREARGALEAPWDEARAAGARAGMRARGRKRAAVRSAGPALVAGAVAALFVWRARAPRASVDAALTVIEPGTTARALGPDALLRVRERGPGSVTVDLERGAAVFRVARRAGGRVFRVHAGTVDVQVLGTEFTVARGATGSRVRVAEGRVRVFYAGRYEDLGPGEEGDFPRGSAVASAPAVAHETSATAEEPTATPSTAVEPSAARRPSLDALLDEAAQAARAGDTAGAVRRWRAVLERDARGERAQRALQGIARTQPAPDAARSFEQAYEAAPRGSVAEDVLRDAAERWLRAGDQRAAQRVARTYVQGFPTGTHIERMREIVSSAP